MAKTSTTTSSTSNGGAPTPTLNLSRVPAETIDIPIVGTTPLLCHRFSAKARMAMLNAAQGRKTPREPKDPQREYQDSLYRVEEGGDVLGFPTLAFKAATVSGGRFYAQVTMTSLRQSMFFHGTRGHDGQQLAILEGEPQLREDVVAVGRGMDLRYRGEFREWKSVLRVTFVTSMLSQESVLSLVEAGGMGVGVGDWRPEKSGEFGTYLIDRDREVEVVSL